VTLFSKKFSPLGNFEYNEANIITVFNDQSYPIELSPKQQFIISCNPFNKSTQQKFNRLHVYLCTPEVFIHHLANQIKNANEGMSNIIHFLANYFDSTDIHISKKKGVFFNKNNQHLLKLPIPKEHIASIIFSIKLNGHMDPTVTRKAQDGSYQFKFKNTHLDVRVASLPTQNEELLSLRIFNKNKTFDSIQALGFSEKKQAAIKSLLTHPHGLILITGSTGSGKSTTMYTMLKSINHQHIITLEDPVEKIIPNIHQTTINKDFSMAASLKAILRHNPEIIAIGEIRDKLTAQTVLNAAYSGHLIIASLHTNSIETTLHRLVSLGCSPFLISYCLRGIISQQLVIEDNTQKLKSELLICSSPPVIISNIKTELHEFLNKNQVICE
jgi:type II secretory ATPase GspE/PulE/Tfp pilus assembly ATPase PilB-like protein